jgi:hypothetical protein
LVLEEATMPRLPEVLGCLPESSAGVESQGPQGCKSFVYAHYLAYYFGKCAALIGMFCLNFVSFFLIGG